MIRKTLTQFAHLGKQIDRLFHSPLCRGKLWPQLQLSLLASLLQHSLEKVVNYNRKVIC